MTGTELPVALGRSRSSMPETSPRLMSRRTQTAPSKSVWFAKASARRTASRRSRTAAAVEPHFAALQRRHRRQIRHFYLARDDIPWAVGSLAEVGPLERHVRSTPQKQTSGEGSACPLCADCVEKVLFR